MFKSAYMTRNVDNEILSLQSSPPTFTDDQCLPTVTIPGVQMISVYLQ